MKAIEYEKEAKAMLTQTVEYALRAMVYLANCEGNSLATSEISVGTKVPPAYLSKVLQQLRQGGLLTTIRGAAGGIRLAKPSTEITILNVVNAIEPLQRIRSCPLGLRTHLGKLCPLHSRLDAVLAATEEVFAKTTLAELLRTPGQVTPLCDTAFPQVVGTIGGLPK